MAINPQIKLEITNKSKILDSEETFWRSVDMAIDILKPIYIGIAKIERNTATLSDVFVVFLEILDAYGDLIIEDSKSQLVSFLCAKFF